MTLGELAVELTADAREFNNKMTEAAESVEATAKRVKRAAREVAMVGVELAAIGAEAVHAAAKSNPATQRAMDDLKSSFERIAAEIGQALLPVMREVTKVVREVGDWFRGLSPALKENAAKFAAVAAAVLIGIGAFGELAGVVSGVASFVSILGGLLSAGVLVPLGLVIAAVGGLVAVVVVLRKAWQENLLGIREYVGSYVSSILEAWFTVKDAVAGALSGIATAFASIFDFAASGVSKALTFMLGALDKILTVAEAAAKATGVDLGSTPGALHGILSGAQMAVTPENLKAGAGAAASAAGGLLSSGKDKVVEAGKSVGGWVAGAFKDAAKDAKGWLDELLKNMGLTGGAEKNALSREKMNVSFGKGAGANDKLLDLMGTQQFQQFFSDLRVAAVQSGAQAPSSLEAAAQYQRERGLRVQLGAGAQMQGRQSDFDLMGPIQKFATWLSDSWLNDAMTRLKDSSVSLQDKIATTFEGIGQSLTNSLINSGGTFGATVNAAMKGFQSGGIWGALMAAISSLLEHSKVFQYIINIANATAQQLADSLGSLLSGLEPIMGALANVQKQLLSNLTPIFKEFSQSLAQLAPMIQELVPILAMLTPVFSLLGKALQAINWVTNGINQIVFYIIKGVGEGIIWILIQLANVWNGIISAVQSVFQSIASIDINIGGKDLGHPFGFLNDWSNSLEGAKASTDGLTAAQTQLKGLTWDQASATAANTAAQLANSDALDKATESLTNVPEGFKVAMERFNSISPGQGQSVYSGTTPGYDSQGNPTSGGTPPSLASGSYSGPGSYGYGSGSSGGSSGGKTINVYIQSSDPNAIWKRIKQLAERDQYRTRGSFARVT